MLWFRVFSSGLNAVAFHESFDWFGKKKYLVSSAALFCILGGRRRLRTDHRNNWSTLAPLLFLRSTPYHPYTTIRLSLYFPLLPLSVTTLNEWLKLL